MGKCISLRRTPFKYYQQRNDDENQVWSSVAESGTVIKNSQDGILKYTPPLPAGGCIRSGFGRNIRTVT